MTYIEIIDLFTFYGVDVAVLGIVTCALTQILKTTLLKKAPNKVYTFLPFAIGCVLYFCYAAVAHTSATFALENFARVFERGLSVGAAATMVYVIYEQFVRGKGQTDLKTLAVAALLEGYFDGEKLNTVAQNIAMCQPEPTCAENKIFTILNSEAAGDMSAEEIKALARIIAKTLEKFNTPTPN